jgi:glycerophosphoryl diester phosphodiesterase
MLVLAHRGANRRAPENTAAAFSQARALGADGVELDVRRCADGTLVVHHDAETSAGAVARTALDVLRQAVPELLTLDEALDACAGMVVNIEMKSPRLDRGGDPDDPGPGAAVVEVLTRRRGDEVVVSSFGTAAIDAVRALDPDRRTALLTFDPGGALGLAAQAGYTMVNPAVAAVAGGRAAEFAAAAHALGIAVMPWTVNEPGDVARLADAGIDAVISDVPEVALAVVRGRSA